MLNINLCKIKKLVSYLSTYDIEHFILYIYPVLNSRKVHVHARYNILLCFHNINSYIIITFSFQLIITGFCIFAQKSQDNTSYIALK